jgi:uncharacterized protein (DUF927 family)
VSDNFTQWGHELWALAQKWFIKMCNYYSIVPAGLTICTEALEGKKAPFVLPKTFTEFISIDYV